MGPVRGNDWRPLLADGPVRAAADVAEVIPGTASAPSEAVRRALVDAARLPGRVVAVAVAPGLDPHDPHGAGWGSGWEASAACVGAPLAVAADLLALARTPSSRGAVPDDATLGHRLSQLGAVLVPVEEAGRRPPSDPVEMALRAKLAHRLPLQRDLRRVSGRLWSVPVVVATVAAPPGTTDAELVACLDALLSSTVEDLLVSVDGPEHDALLAAVYPDHPRVLTGDAAEAARCDVDAPFRLQWPVAAAPTPRSVEGMLAVAHRRRAVAVPLLVPGSELTPVLWRRAALARLGVGDALPPLPGGAARLEAAGDVWWLDAAAVGVGARGSGRYHGQILWERADTPSSRAVRLAEAEAVRANETVARLRRRVDRRRRWLPGR